MEEPYLLYHELQTPVFPFRAKGIPKNRWKLLAVPSINYSKTKFTGKTLSREAPEGLCLRCC